MTDSDLWKGDLWHELIARAPLTFERAGCRQIPRPSLVVSAGSLVRRPVVDANWIATADAALAFDPLSGQGVLKSIETGTRCAAATAGYFAGDPGALKSYDSWVQETYDPYLSVRRHFLRCRAALAQFAILEATTIVGGTPALMRHFQARLGAIHCVYYPDL